VGIWRYNMKGKKIMITGGLGFLGLTLTRALAPENEVIILDIGSPPGGFDTRGVHLVKKDIRDETIQEWFTGVDIVYHFAAHVTFPDSSVKTPKLDADVNILGTINILEACRKKNISKIVFSSTASVYGVSKHIPIKEDELLTPLTPYGMAKKTCEEYISLYYRLYGLKEVRLRLFNVYGKGQTPHAVIPWFISLIKKGNPVHVFGDGSFTRDFIHVDDVVHAAILAGMNPCTGAFNVGTGRETSINKLLDMLKQIYGDFEIIFLPEKDGGIPRSVADTEKANCILGFNSIISLEDGIKILTQNHK
jgi:UDP-glucose 4-epimerase